MWLRRVPWCGTVEHTADTKVKPNPMARTAAHKKVVPGSWQGPRMDPTVLVRMGRMPHDPDRGHRIKELRNALGLTQEALADELGLSKNGHRSIQDWEAGQGISYPNLRKLVDYFNRAGMEAVDIAYIMRGVPATGEREEQYDKLAAEVQSIREDMDRLLDFLGVSEGEEIAEEGVGPMRLATEHAASSSAQSSSGRKRRAK